MIDLTNISKSYDGGATFAVHRTNLHINKGEFLVLLGESGCGKHSFNLTIAGDYEFFGRPEWTRIRDAYRLDFQDQRQFQSI